MHCSWIQHITKGRGGKNNPALKQNSRSEEGRFWPSFHCNLELMSKFKDYEGSSDD